MLAPAYIAGFFDGEGSISIIYQQPPGRRVTHRLVVAVAQVDPAVPHMLQEQFGGSVSLRKGIGNHRSAVQWTASAADAETFLRTILPFLIVKRRQAEVALRFRGLFGGHLGTVGRGRNVSPELYTARENCRLELLSLNRRGPM